MKPVYFPFTFMTESVLEACCRFFKEIVVVQATDDNIPNQMKVWQAEGRIDLQIPKPDEANITAMLRDYRTWAQYHQGGDISVYKYYKDKIPFFDEPSIAQIKKGIRAADTGERTDHSLAGNTLLLQARLFLQMAQEFDEQSLDIARNFKDQEEMEKGLFEGLRGEGELSAMPEQTESLPLSDEPFGYMLSDRLSAWVRVMLSCDMPGELFITSSREAIESAVDDIHNTETAMYVEKIPGFTDDADVKIALQQAFMDHLKKLSQMSLVRFHEDTVPQFPVENGDENLAMELYVIPGISPPEFFSRFLPMDPTAHAVIKNNIPIKNTMLGLIIPAKETHISKKN